MKLFYISHPYTGNEQYNLHNAERIATELSNLYPNTVFINPLNVFRHLQNSKLSYEQVLKQCLCILDFCDGIILAGDWQYSKGCQAERERATSNRMIIFTGIENFKIYYEEDGHE